MIKKYAKITYFNYALKVLLKILLLLIVAFPITYVNHKYFGSPLWGLYVQSIIAPIIFAIYFQIEKNETLSENAGYYIDNKRKNILLFLFTVLYATATNVLHHYFP